MGTDNVGNAGASSQGAAGEARERLSSLWGPSAEQQQARKDEQTAKLMEDFRKGKEAELQKEEVRAGKYRLPPLARPDDLQLEFAMQGDSTVKIEYLSDPWLPRRQVVGFYGRGETGKSSFVATLAALGSEDFSTLWVSTEEPTDWIKTRHLAIDGAPASLAVFKALVTKQDHDGRAMASSFNVYEHLEPAIQKAQRDFGSIHDGHRPLRLVVLDTAIALTTWQRGESPNDDASTKRLLAYLLFICQKFDVTIVIIGHSNKGKHEQLADTVAGSAAWVNSLRQAFIFLSDQEAEYQYVVCTVKSTLTGTFASIYRTQEVHELYRRADGRRSVLCKVILDGIEWGRRNAMELVDAALGRNQDDDAQAGHKETAVMKMMQATLTQLNNGAPTVDRDTVERMLGGRQNKRHWQEVDYLLTTDHGVRMNRGPRGKIFYSKG